MRIPMNPGAFADLMPEGSKLYMPSVLPTIEYKMHDVNYEIADLTLLHQGGKVAFYGILERAASDENLGEVVFSTEGVSEEDLEIITDIVMGFTYKAEKKGRNGWMMQGKYMVMGCESGEDTITFKLDKGAVKSLARLAKEKEGKINIDEAIERYCEDKHKELRDQLN
jgi:hypothetical protein